MGGRSCPQQGLAADMDEGSVQEPTLARRRMQALIEPPDERPVERTVRGDATLVEEPPVAAAAATPNLRAPELYILTAECS